jgi:hypothetical protein
MRITTIIGVMLALTMALGTFSFVSMQTQKAYASTCSDQASAVYNTKINTLTTQLAKGQITTAVFNAQINAANQLFTQQLIACSIVRA